MALNVGGKSEGEVMSDINVTPLVDVMLVLLIIFIITIPVIVQQVHLTLPKATNLPTQTKPENITVAVDKEGNIYWNTRLLASNDELKVQLRGIARERPPARGAHSRRRRRSLHVRRPRAGGCPADRHPQGGVFDRAGSLGRGDALGVNRWP